MGQVIIRAGKVVTPTTFAHEQPGGMFRVHYWPPGQIATGVTAQQLVAMRRRGERVVVYMLAPAGAIVDLVIIGTQVRWVVRPSAPAAPVTPVTSSASAA